MQNKLKFLDRLKNMGGSIKNLPKKFFSINLSHNTGTKAFSLALAALFWLFVMDQVDPEITKEFENVPVQLINIQELDQNDFIIMDQHDYFVNVEVSGRRNNVLDLSASSLYLWADVRNVNKGSNILQINKTINSEAATIKALTPNEIILEIDQIVSIPKPVKVSISGSFPNDLYQKEMVVSPEEVKVTGPESIVNTVSYLGGTINISNVAEDMTKEVSLVPYNNDGEMVTGVLLDANYSSVSVSVGMNKTVPVKAVVTGVPYDGFELVRTEITPESTVISGKESVINALDEVSIEPITLKGQEVSSFIVEKPLLLPDGISSNIANNTVQLNVVIEQVITKEFTYEIKDLPIVNLKDNLSVDLSQFEDSINVKIKDLESVVDAVSKEDINLSVNFIIVEKAGLYRLFINVADRDKYRELVVSPSYVEIQVDEIPQ